MPLPKRRLPLSFYDDGSQAPSLISLCQKQLRTVPWKVYMLETLHYSQRHPEVPPEHLLNVLTQTTAQSQDTTWKNKEEENEVLIGCGPCDYEHLYDVHHITTCTLLNVPFRIEMKINCNVDYVVPNLY